MELQSIPALCSFFCADLTEEMKKAIDEYQGLESIKRSALRENEDGLRTLCAFLKQHPSPFIASLEPSVMGEYLFGSQYCVVVGRIIHS